MSLASNMNSTFKTHGYSIATAVVIALLISGYIVFILPQNETNEDRTNIEYFKTIETQFKSYISDQANEIGANRLEKARARYPEKEFYIDDIVADTVVKVDNAKKVISLNRFVYFKRIVEDTETADGLSHSDSIIPKKEADFIVDTVYIDLKEFLNRIDASTSFDAFYMCPVSGKGDTCDIRRTLFSKNVNLADRDSLKANSRKNTKLDFRKSDYRYYADQITVSGTNFTVFLAAGVQKTKFENKVRYIKSGLLIFSLLLVITLLLSISFIKPVISSYKERLSQMDLVSVIFSIGALTAVLVIFWLVMYWDSTVKNRNDRDLKNLVTYIDSSFTRQIDTLKTLGDYPIFKNARRHSFYNFSIDGRLPQNDSLSQGGGSQLLAIHADDVKGTDNLNSLKYLDTYFRMDEEGLITSNINKEKTGYRRKFNDRTYFKELQNLGIYSFLTAVFSRENDQYQWIYADSTEGSNGKSKKGIYGIAFRESFAKHIVLPPETDYMIVDQSGNVLMHKQSKINLYQNLFTGSANYTQLSLIPKEGGAFTMDYQGKNHQVFAKKLSLKNLDSPIYILGMRNLSHLSYLSVFTFGNASLISVLYGFFILLITLIYSTLFYNGRIGIFSGLHFHYLFPDNSRQKDYRMLLAVNVTVIVILIFVSLLTSPSAALVCCIVLGINVAFVNFIVLNIRGAAGAAIPFKSIAILIVASVFLPLVCLAFESYFGACLALFGSHVGFILYYRKWRDNFTEDLNQYALENNKGVIRRVYTRFLTATLLNHFAVFPFVLVSAFYASEINDYARYYCASHTIAMPFEKVGSAVRTSKLAVVKNNVQALSKEFDTYGCNCTDTTIYQPQRLYQANDSIIQKLGFLEHPTVSEARNFSFKKLGRQYYLNSTILFRAQVGLLLILILCFLVLGILAYALVNYYSNRFFFYDLMQAAYRGYYPCRKYPLANDQIFIPMIDGDEIAKMVQTGKISDEEIIERHKMPVVCEGRMKIEQIFTPEMPVGVVKSEQQPITRNTKGAIQKEILPGLQAEFINNQNQNEYGATYLKVFNGLPDDAKKVLFDFAQDHFVNYKNKEVLMYLMDIGIVDHDKLTGRLKVMSPGFRSFIVALGKRNDNSVNDFMATVEDDTKNGTFGKLKFPILIIATSLLLLMMYLKKDSYEQVIIFGGSITSVLVILSRLMTFGKPE